MDEVKAAAELLLEKLTAHLVEITPERLTTQAAKQASSALKDIRDLLTEKDNEQNVVIEMGEELQGLAG